MTWFPFLSVNRFGELRDDNDPNCTYEGDNNMLLWQSSSYLLSLLEAKQKGKLQYTKEGLISFSNKMISLY